MNIRVAARLRDPFFTQKAAKLDLCKQVTVEQVLVEFHSGGQTSVDCINNVDKAAWSWPGETLGCESPLITLLQCAINLARGNALSDRQLVQLSVETYIQRQKDKATWLKCDKVGTCWWCCPIRVG